MTGLPRCLLDSEVYSQQPGVLKGAVLLPAQAWNLSGTMLSVWRSEPARRVLTIVDEALSAVRVQLGGTAVAHHWAALAGKLRRSTGARPG